MHFLQSNSSHLCHHGVYTSNVWAAHIHLSVSTLWGDSHLADRSQTQNKLPLHSQRKWKNLPCKRSTRGHLRHAQTISKTTEPTGCSFLLIKPMLNNASHTQSPRVQPYLQKHHIWDCVEYGITYTVISDVPLASLPMQTVRPWVAYSRQTAIRAMYHQGDADFTGLAGFCRWRHDQQAPVLQARWHCLVNPPLLGNPSQGEREGESKSEREREKHGGKMSSARASLEANQTTQVAADVFTWRLELFVVLIFLRNPGAFRVSVGLWVIWDQLYIYK